MYQKHSTDDIDDTHAEERSCKMFFIVADSDCLVIFIFYFFVIFHFIAVFAISSQFHSLTLASFFPMIAFYGIVALHYGLVEPSRELNFSLIAFLCFRNDFEFQFQFFRTLV